MPGEAFGALGGISAAVQRFVLYDLEPVVLGPDCPASIRLDLAFSRFLRAHGVDELRAGEAAVEHQLLVRRKVTEHITRWRDQGVPAPIEFVEDRENTVATWRHAQFAEVTGAGEAPGANFAGVADVYAWLGAQQGRAFLLPCLCFLKLLGCDPIFVTDASFDEGIDCIGLVASGGLRSAALFVQARSKSDLFAGDELLQEYAKYAGLPRTPKYLEYLRALGVAQRRDGAAFLYAVLTNSDFRHAAQEAAVKLGALLRSRRQLAQFLATRYTREQLDQLRATVALPVAANLERNFAPELPG